jgi:cytochrome c2
MDLTRLPCGARLTGVLAVSLSAMCGSTVGVEIAAPPVVGAYERFAGQTAATAVRLDARDAGRLLIGELGCTACHATGNTALAPKAGPDLAGVGARVDDRWLRRYLAAPAAAAPGTTMPHALAALPVAEQEVAIESLAAYLATRVAPVPLPKPNGLNPMPPAFWDRGDAVAGATLYHRVGCVACHPPAEGRAGVVATTDPTSLLDEEELAEAGIPLPEKPFASLPLAHVAAKYSRRSLTEFLMVPLHARPSGRMPAIQLKAAEAADIAAFLGDVSEEVAARESAAEPRDPALVQRGRAACVTLRCVACHSGLDVEQDAVAPPAPPALATLDPRSAGSCIAPDDTARTGRPWYPLAADQRAAIVAALDASRADDVSPTRDDRGVTARLTDLELTLLRLNCVACHERDGRGGVGTDRRAFFETVDHVDLGDEGRLPPRLTGVGARLQKAWLAKAVAGAVALRPFMRARMPVYPKEAVAALPGLFQQADRVAADGPATKAPAAFPPPGDRAALVPAGAALLDAGCVQCHPLGDHTLPGTVGVNLAGVTKRVEPEWFRRLLLDPMAVRPGTKMPAFFGATVNRTILDGDPERQIAALWAYLDRPALEPLPAKLAAATGDFELVPETRPIVLRTFMERAGTHAIAVGFPAGVHAAFDADTCRLAEAWRGRFLDARGTWVLAKSAPPADPLGSDRVAIDPRPAVAVLNAADDAPDASRVRFLGYAFDRDGVPTFRYRVDAADGAAEIAERFTPEATAPRGGLARRLTVRRAADAPALPRGLVLRALAGADVDVRVGDDAGVTARMPDTSLTATLDAATAARAVIGDAGRAWIVPLEADDTTVEVRYRW